MHTTTFSRGKSVGGSSGVGLRRHFGTWQATALNVTMIVGAGVFITIPPMLKALPGPYALCGWLAAGALVLFDSLVWSELGTALPGAGGSYLYLLEAYGRQRWGRLLAFLFIWQLLLSGPLELASGLIALDTFAQSLSPALHHFNKAHSWVWDIWPQEKFRLILSPGRLGCVALGLLLIFLLYRGVQTLGRLTVFFWIAVLAASAWIIVSGLVHFDPARAFRPPAQEPSADAFLTGLGEAMGLALYSYLGYYTICYVSEETRDPGRTIPRSILLSVALVSLLFLAVHLALLGTVPWEEARAEYLLHGDDYSLAAVFMERTYGPWAVRLITVLLMVSCFGSAFAGLLAYSRLPYGAAVQGHFFGAVARVHPVHHIPHVSLLLVGGLTLFWSFFDLENVIKALITTRILAQLLAQVVGVMILRQTRPDLPRPFRIPLYPLPCLLALAGWLFVLFSSAQHILALAALVLLLGVLAFVLWSRGWKQDT
jgi:amino acid transporter